MTAVSNAGSIQKAVATHPAPAPIAVKMKMPFFDLTRQYQSLKKDVLTSFETILDKQALNIFETDKEQLLNNATQLQLVETKMLENDVLLKYSFL